MPAWRRMFQTITVNPSVQSPPLLRRLSGWFANKNPARVCWHLQRKVAPGRGLGNPDLAKGILRGLRFANSRGAPKVPHGTSCCLLTRHHAQAPAVLDHSRALAQCDGGAGPAFAGGAVRCECNLVVLDAGDVLDDAFPVSGPGIDTEGEMRSRCGHLRPLLFHSSSASRFTAGASHACVHPRRW